MICVHWPIIWRYYKCNWCEMNNISKCCQLVSIPGCFVKIQKNPNTTSSFIETIMFACVFLCRCTVCLYILCSGAQTFLAPLCLISLLSQLVILHVLWALFAVCEESWKRACVRGTKTTGRVNALTQNHKSSFSLALSLSLWTRLVGSCMPFYWLYETVQNYN